MINKEKAEEEEKLVYNLCQVCAPINWLIMVIVMINIMGIG